jgi:hypothetical protein
MTSTVTAAALLVPPAPVQVIENVVFPVSAPVLRVPLDAIVPFQPPEAMQELASVELHVNVDSSPLLIVSFAALIDTVGRGDEAAPPALPPLPAPPALPPPPPPPPQAANNCAATSATNGVNDRMTSPLFFFFWVGELLSRLLATKRRVSAAFTAECFSFPTALTR